MHPSRKSQTRRNKLRRVEGRVERRKDPRLRIPTRRPWEERPNPSAWNNREGQGFCPRGMRDTNISEIELARRNMWLEELMSLKLNAPLSTILRKVKSLGVPRAPKPIKMSLEKRNRNKFCDFHQDYRHTTDECFTLKRQIAVLIKTNQLLEFLEKDGNQRREEARPSTSSGGGQVRTSNTIHGRTDQ